MKDREDDEAVQKHQCRRKVTMRKAINQTQLGVSTWIKIMLCWTLIISVCKWTGSWSLHYWHKDCITSQWRPREYWFLKSERYIGFCRTGKIPDPPPPPPMTHMTHYNVTYVTYVSLAMNQCDLGSRVGRSLFVTCKVAHGKGGM